MPTRPEVETTSLIEEIKSRMDGENPLSTREIAERLGKIPLAFDPGTTFRYGMSADILGAVIEVVSGKRFGEFLKERIFEPLGMVDTGFFVPPEKQSRLAQTYEQQKDGFTFTPAAIWEFRAGWNVNRPMKPGEPGW